MRFLFLVMLVTIYSLLNAQTNELVAVPGTKISLVPPKGFSKATNFAGFFHNETKSSIVVTELPVSIKSSVDGFSADALKQKGMVLADKKTVKHQGMNGALLKIYQSANGVTYDKQVLLFGDDKKTIMINGIYPETAKHLESDIAKSLESVVYNENAQAKPLDASPFSIDTKASGLTFVQYLNGSLLYSADGKIPTSAPTFIVSPSNGTVNVTDKKQYALERIKKLPGGESILVKETNPVNIDKLSGYEIIAEGKDVKGKSNLIYVVMLFTANNAYFMMAGDAGTEKEKWLANFKEVAKTFHIK